VSPESDGGIDKFQVLSAINASGAPPPAVPAPGPDRPPSAVRPAIPPAPPPVWVRHRAEIAAIVSAFVGMIWLAVGLARASWWPCFTGILFGVGSLAIWALEVWSTD
jgi:hypothetical protein